MTFGVLFHDPPCHVSQFITMNEDRNVVGVFFYLACIYFVFIQMKLYPLKNTVRNRMLANGRRRGKSKRGT